MESKSTTKKEVKQETVTMEQKEKTTQSKDVTSLPGVGAATAEKLKEAGFETLMSIAVASPGLLVDAAGVTESVGRKMINAARSALDMGFESGNELLEKRKHVVKITSGSESFDALMGGGFESGSITEVYGEYGCGKTQIAHLLAVNLQLTLPGAYAVYVDTENTFRPERIIELAEGAGLDPTDVLKHIKVARAYNSDHQMLLGEKVGDLINNEGLDVKLVIVDSLTAHFRAEFIGRGTLSDRQQKLNKHMHTLLRLGDTFNVCVYVTNQVMSKPDVFFGDPTQAIGGHVVGHASTFRIYLRKGKKGSRVAKLIDAPNLPEGEVNFYVERGGLRDI